MEFIKSMSRCFRCWRLPQVQCDGEGAWLISCDGVNVAGETLDIATERWNAEMTKAAAGLVA